MENKKLVCLLYDFDGTLAPGNMQEFTFAPKLLQMEKNEWWDNVNEFGKKHNMDPVLSVMYKMISVAKEKGLSIKRDDFVQLGKDIKYFDGVETWFERINAYGKSLGLKVQHFIISSGLKEIIEGTSIAHNFKRIFASCYVYDDEGNAFWPGHAVNYSTKTQFIHRIRKNVLDDLYETKSVNRYLPDDKDLVLYENMIYFGDGETDIPAMKTISKKGGNAICVYDPNKKSAETTSKKIYLDKRADYLTKADWSENSELEQIVKSIFRKIASYLEEVEWLFLNLYCNQSQCVLL